MITIVEQDSLLRRVAAALHIGTWDRDDYGRLRRGSWQQSYSGQKFWALDPRPEEIHYDDICIGLARECRYGNHVRDGWYSVGEHSVIVSLFCERLARERGCTEEGTLYAARLGLLHDAPEAFLGDIPRPLKRQHVMRGYNRLEEKWLRRVLERFGLLVPPPNVDVVSVLMLVKEVDNRILIDEIDALMLDPDMWERAGRYADVEPLGAEIAALDWEQAAAAFSQRWAELWPAWLEGVVTPNEIRKPRFADTDGDFNSLMAAAVP